jgi:amino acid transporter
VLLVLFMVVVGAWHSSTRNLVEPFVPPAGINSAGEAAYGWDGVLRGTALAFFGFVGFDEVRGGTRRQCRVASPAGTRRRPCSAQKQRLNKVVY